MKEANKGVNIRTDGFKVRKSVIGYKTAQTKKEKKRLSILCFATWYRKGVKALEF